MPESRDDHIAWAKHRALELLDGGDDVGALSSIMSDLMKHDATHLSLDDIREAQGRVGRSEGTLRSWIEALK